MSGLAALEAKRDAKRRQVEALFEQQQAIQRHMAALQAELQALDDEIEALEEQSQEVSYEQEELLTMNPDEILTEPAAATMTHPDDILTEPTQMEESSASFINVARPGQLHITKRSNANRAATPPGLQQTSTVGKKRTLDDFFATTQREEENTPPPSQSAARPPAQLKDDRENDADYMDVPESSFRPATSTGTMSLSAQIKDLLNNTFQIQSFRGHQEEIIHSTLAGRDVFCIMRTGGGKSLTYQLPSLLEGRGPERKITFVISPLLSLIRDQEDQMNQYARGSAVSFSSNIGREEHARRWGLVRDATIGVCLVFVTPEKIHKSNKVKSEMEKLYEQGRLGRFVIDECHCCSNWGHDFRPDYTKLGLLKTHFPSIPMLAVTATASDRVRENCCQILRISRDYQFFRSTAKRPNLTYSVRPKTKQVVDDMADFIKTNHPDDAGIIYAFSRKEADEVADKLCERGIVARSYHSTISDKNKELIHKSWMRNETQVVVATIAFGLGINKPNVRFVLHHSLSKSLEAYYQESGRAGRDGGPADCILYYAPKDVPRVICLIHGDNGEHTFWTMVRYAQASGNDTVCKAILMKTLGEPDCQDIDDVVNAHDGVTTLERDIGPHAKTVTNLLQYKTMRGQDLTLPMLVKEWRSKNAPECVSSNPPGKDLSADDCERIIVCLLLENVISPNIVWNAYTSNMYLKLGSNAEPLMASQNPRVFVRLPIKPAKAAKSSSKKAKKAVGDEDGWIHTRKPKPKKTKDQPKKNGTKKPKAGATKPRKKTRKEEIIDLLDESSSEDDEPILNSAGRVSWDGPGSDSEFELE